jgi:hypothetical protein
MEMEMELGSMRLHEAIQNNDVNRALVEIRKNPEIIKSEDDFGCTALKRMFCANRYQMAAMTLATVPAVDFYTHPGLVYCVMNIHPRKAYLLLLYKYGFPFGPGEDVPVACLELQRELQILIAIASVRIQRLGSKSPLRQLPNALLFNALPAYIRTEDC